MKYHPHGSVLFVTFSIEQGLLLLANPLCEALIKSCLARAKFMHPVKLCHCIIEATHVHLIVVVVNPDDFVQFIRHFKTESATRLNIILGRAKRTIWCESYDDPVVLTKTRALSAIAYMYSNPAKDNLETTIDKYPGFSTWKMFIKGEHTKEWKMLWRPAFSALANDSHNLRGYTKEANKILEKAKLTHQLFLEPNAWMEAFGITDPTEQAQLNAQLIENVRSLEAEAQKERDASKGSVIGREQLMNQPLNTTHLPKNRKGKRMWCLSDDIELRVAFINFLKNLFNQAKEVQRLWSQGDLTAKYPLGLHPPSMPKLAEPIAVW